MATKLGPSRVLLLWRSPAQWAQALQQWVNSVGGAGTVYTLYELVEGDETRGEGNWQGESSLFVLKVCLLVLMRAYAYANSCLC